MRTQANILLDGEGHAVLADLGLSKSLASDASKVSTQAAAGTLFFT
jgi:serine/threonine protein kinase